MTEATLDTLTDILAARIARTGPITLADYMAEALSTPITAITPLANPSAVPVISSPPPRSARCSGR